MVSVFERVQEPVAVEVLFVRVRVRGGGGFVGGAGGCERREELEEGEECEGGVECEEGVSWVGRCIVGWVGWVGLG